MTSNLYVVTDLGVGDGGKGTIVHAVASAQRAHTIIKRGGAQGSHGVQTSRGETFAFSQWGCGTFEGIPTHLSREMVVSPEGLLNEAAALRYEHGITEIFDLLTVDEDALCATPFHGIASRLIELARGDNARGTVGTGVGDAYRQRVRQPDIAITAKDLRGSGLRQKMAAIRDEIQMRLDPILTSEFLAQDRERAAREIALLFDDGFFEYVVDRFATAGRQANIVSRDYLGEVILPKAGVAIVESSHGILSDREYGFHPHTSALRTMPEFTEVMIREAGFEDRIVHLGVTRAFAVRHGAGPMPTVDMEGEPPVLSDQADDENRYQGKVRTGPLDFVLLRYALAASAPIPFDGLAVTWCDQPRRNKRWSWSTEYEAVDDPMYFTLNGDVRVAHHPTPMRQQALGDRLSVRRPIVTHTPVDPTVDTATFSAHVAQVVESKTGVPVRMTSFGPTERDKLFI